MSFKKWRQFLAEGSGRGTGAGIERSLSRLLDTGPQKEGSPYENERTHFGKKKRKDISAPPGAPGGGSIGHAASLEEEVEEETFEMQTELQPEIWYGDKLWPEVRERLLEIVHDFIDGLEVDIFVEDIKLTGSLANYNWSKYSDADLHIVVDFSKIDEDTQLVKSFFDAARARWNDLHAINVYGFEVEIYIENLGDVHYSSGMYSVENDKWIIHPKTQDVNIDFATARKKSDDIETRVNLIDYMISAGKLSASLKSIEKVKEKIRKMRQAGLSSPQREFSAENIAFKILRRNNILAKLSQMKRNAYDRHMTLAEAKKNEISRNQ